MGMPPVRYGWAGPTSTWRKPWVGPAGAPSMKPNSPARARRKGAAPGEGRARGAGRTDRHLAAALGRGGRGPVDEAELAGPGQVEGGRPLGGEQLEAEGVGQAAGGPGGRQGARRRGGE